MKINDTEKILKASRNKKMYMTFNEATVKLMIDFFNRNCENPQDNEWNDKFKALKENKISK